MPRVLQLNKYYHPHIGGVETVVRQINEALGSEWSRTVSVCNEGEDTIHEAVDGVQACRAETLLRVLRMPISLRYLRQTKNLLEGADIVVWHHPFPLALPLLLFTKKPFVVWYHADVQGGLQRIVDWLLAPMMRRVLTRSVCIIVSSHNLKQAGRHLRSVQEKIEVIPFAVTDVTRAASARLDGNEIRLLSVGRLVTYKGYDIALRALAKVSFPFRYTIVGGGPEKEHLQELAGVLGIGPHIRWVSYEPHLDKYYEQSDIFLLPSRTAAEAFGIVQIEAMGFGLPVINTDLPTGVPEVSLDGVSGITVPPGDASALSGAIERLASNPKLRKKLSQGALRRACSRYSWERFVAAIRLVLNNNIGGSQKDG